jgi:hypothetical protein
MSVACENIHKILSIKTYAGKYAAPKNVYYLSVNVLISE